MTINRKLLLGLIFVAIVLLIFGVEKCGNMNADLESWRTAFNTKDQQVTIWRNKYGQSQAEVKSASMTIDVINQQHIAELENAKAVISGLRKDLKNLQSSTTVSTTITGGGTTLLHDTIFSVPGHPTDTGRAFSYADDWAKIDGYFLREEAHISYSVKDSLQIVSFWKKQSGVLGIFKPREFTVDVISLNPHSEIQKLKSIVVRDRPKKFVIGPYVGIDATLRPSFGFGVTYKLIEF